MPVYPLAMIARTVNSYTRLIPGLLAPTDASWGIENRNRGRRASSRAGGRASGSSTGAADINPHRARLRHRLGLGDRESYRPGEPTKGNAYEVKFPSERALPRTLYEVAERL